MTDALSWQPTASLHHLRGRAAVMTSLRRFFADRAVLEVETPVLSAASITDLQLGFMETRWHGPGASSGKRLFLHTSPEFPMKRLLCAGYGDIYQICKVFRDDESGRYHNPEFTMLEWYRLGFDHHQLMTEVDALLQQVLRCPAGERLSYAAAFQQVLAIDPHSASDAVLASLCADRAQYTGSALDRDGMLQLLFSICIEPTLGHDRPCFIFDFPASQAALAQIRPETPPVASRFEVYVNGIELANGFHELADAAEQRRRFLADNDARHARGLPAGELDEALLAALAQGLPACAGVALGVDRLVMLALGARHIDEVLSFTIRNA
ncbi:elongation factor P--(R)-beta-lysine ligase [Permianibacter sp. IMCC34836]|uniref:elongation factor P--(R)-beta-lysine ligase n=1 Tax=Permianibacter fluminis TaxID=2738515 RepID=UPI001553BF57|nr:elongation factor P--(R)-beta-lysine ligase [Permianibacter fluminis]NQD36569.1 elongation factor P--(R)-beta-lysine ligase [Permianibacter fluminis]